MVPLKYALEYLRIEQDAKALQIKSEFFETLKNNVVNYGGTVSRNGHRLIIPLLPCYCPFEDRPDNSGSNGDYDGWPRFRAWLRGTIIMLNDMHSRTVVDFNYIKGTCRVRYQNGSEQDMKIGKILVRNNIKYNPLKDFDYCRDSVSNGVKAIDMFNTDPIRLRKPLTKVLEACELCMIVSDHPYDVIGMSYDRDWTSCMNIEDGDNREYVWNDVKYCTMIVYLCEKNDTNIQHPYARLLLKQYKLQRTGHKCFDPCPVVYFPENTVYSSYTGMVRLVKWWEDRCQRIQLGHGLLRVRKELYNDTSRAPRKSLRQFESYLKEN